MYKYSNYSKVNFYLNRRHILSKKRIIALPVYKADPDLQNECLYKKHTVLW